MNKEWKEMQMIWDEMNGCGPTVDEVLNYVVDRAEKVDRRMRWEQRLSWLGTVVGLLCVVDLLTIVESPVEVAFAISMALFLIGLSVHIWVKSRAMTPVDRSLSRSRFREIMEAKFQSQIRLLRVSRYWFLLPLAVTGGATIWSYARGSAEEKDWFFFPLILLGATAASWFNEACAIRGIRNEWENVRRALDDGELP